MLDGWRHVRFDGQTQPPGVSLCSVARTFIWSRGRNSGKRGRSTAFMTMPSGSTVHSWLLHCISGVVASAMAAAPGGGSRARGDWHCVLVSCALLTSRRGAPCGTLTVHFFSDNARQPCARTHASSWLVWRLATVDGTKSLLQRMLKPSSPMPACVCTRCAQRAQRVGRLWLAHP